MNALSGPPGLRILARAALAALAALVAPSACTPERKPRPSAEAPSRPQATLYGVRMHLFRGGELRFLGRAARLSFHRATRDVAAREALLQLRPAHDAFEVRAPELRGSLGTRVADLSGGVRLRGAGLTGETESARLDWPSRVASGERPVTLRGPGFSVHASSFHLDLGEEAFDFAGDVATDLQEAGR